MTRPSRFRTPGHPD